jgi:hypothetical protein
MPADGGKGSTLLLLYLAFSDTVGPNSEAGVVFMVVERHDSIKATGRMGKVGTAAETGLARPCTVGKVLHYGHNPVVLSSWPGRAELEILRVRRHNRSHSQRTENIIFEILPDLFQQDCTY